MKAVLRAFVRGEDLRAGSPATALGAPQKSIGIAFVPPSPGRGSPVPNAVRSETDKNQSVRELQTETGFAIFRNQINSLEGRSVSVHFLPRTEAPGIIVTTMERKSFSQHLIGERISFDALASRERNGIVRGSGGYGR
jgi:hypothetical protein